jgi:hypothetical protein
LTQINQIPNGFKSRLLTDKEPINNPPKDPNVENPNETLSTLNSRY